MSTDQAVRTPTRTRTRTLPGPLASRAPARPTGGATVHATAASVAVLMLLAAGGALLHQPVLIPPLAASAALIHSGPALPLSQPRSVIGGHLLSAVTGYAVLAVLGHSAWAAALAGGLAVAVMMVSRTPHSPAAATAVIVVLQTPHTVRFLALLASATTLLVLAGIAGSRARRTAVRYPAYWW